MCDLIRIQMISLPDGSELEIFHCELDICFFEHSVRAFYSLAFPHFFQHFIENRCHIVLSGNV